LAEITTPTPQIDSFNCLSSFALKFFFSVRGVLLCACACACCAFACVLCCACGVPLHAKCTCVCSVVHGCVRGVWRVCAVLCVSVCMCMACV
jgi:hypothetical protein